MWDWTDTLFFYTFVGLLVIDVWVIAIGQAR